MIASLGERAELRPLPPVHAADLAACVDRAREYLAPWTVLASRVVDEASARQLLELYANPPRYFGIRLDGTLVGGALFRTFDTQAGVCEVGGWLTPDAQGHGLITRAFRQMIGWAINFRGMSRVELRANPQNARARAIAVRLGMTHEATLRNAFTLNGTSHDSEIWSIVAEDLPASRAGESSDDRG